MIDEIAEAPQLIAATFRERVRMNRICYFLFTQDGAIQVVSPSFFREKKRRKGVDQKYPFESLAKARVRLGKRIFGKNVRASHLHHVHVHDLAASAAPYDILHVMVYIAPPNFVPRPEIENHLLNPYGNLANTPRENQNLMDFADMIRARFAPVVLQSESASEIDIAAE